MLHYLAYGSNLHPVRLRARVPTATLVGTVELPGRALSFSKRSRDGSGKCTIVPADELHSLFGAVYRIDPREKHLLDNVEGLGAGYDQDWVALRVQGVRYRAFVYIAQADYMSEDLQPYGWYKALVLAGAKHHRFPEHHIAAIEAVRSVPDPDEDRNTTNMKLLSECLGSNRKQISRPSE